jgi:hypothetical protein
VELTTKQNTRHCVHRLDAIKSELRGIFKLRHISATKRPERDERGSFIAWSNCVTASERKR